MKHEILQPGSYATLKCILDTGEEIKTESGAMLAMDAGTVMEGKMQGGLWGALKRSILTSESFFVTTIKAQKPETEVYLAPRVTGDVKQIDLHGDEYIVQGGSFLAATGGIETDAHFSGWKGFLSGEGIFMIKTRGTGTMFISSFGAILEKELKPGEKFTVDNGHLVAFPSSLQYEIKTAGGMMGAVTTGEGLICILTGPGKVYMQSRNLRTFAETLNPFLPRAEKTAGKGLLGQVFGG